MKETQKERFMRLYAPVNDRFERFCKARAYGEVDFKDLMHDSLIVAFEKINQVKDDAAFLHFLFGTAVRILANKRKKNRPIYTNDFNHFAQVPSTERSVELTLEIENLYKQLARLDEVTRECIILFEISGFSIKEIMVIQKSGESAVKQRLHRGRNQLIKWMNSTE